MGRPFQGEPWGAPPYGPPLSRGGGSAQPSRRGPAGSTDSHWTPAIRDCLLLDLSGASRQLPFTRGALGVYGFAWGFRYSLLPAARPLRRFAPAPLHKGSLGGVRIRIGLSLFVGACRSTSQALRASSPSQGEPWGVRIRIGVSLFVAACRSTSQALRASSPSQGEPWGCTDSHWGFGFCSCLLPELSVGFAFRGSLWKQGGEVFTDAGEVLIHSIIGDPHNAQADRFQIFRARSVIRLFFWLIML